MSRENVELVRRMYEAYLSGDAERALDFFHPDAEADFSVRIDAGVGRGREELGRVVTAWVATWDDYSEEIDEIIDLGDKVCLAATQRGRGKGSGVEIVQRFAGLYEVRDGLITRITIYMDRDSAVEAARASDAS